MKMKKVSSAVKRLDESRTLLDFLNTFYKDKRIKPVDKTSSFFSNFKIMENFWDWLDAQDIHSDKLKFLIDDIGIEKQKYLLKNPFINAQFNDKNDKNDENYDDKESTIDFHGEDEEIYQYN